MGSQLQLERDQNIVNSILRFPTLKTLLASILMKRLLEEIASILWEANLEKFSTLLSMKTEKQLHLFVSTLPEEEGYHRSSGIIVNQNKDWTNYKKLVK